MYEAIYNLFSVPNCTDIKELLSYALSYAQDHSHAAITIEHLVYGFMKFCEIHTFQNDGDYTLFPWYVKTSSYEYLSKLWNMSAKKDKKKTNTIESSYDVALLASMYKKFFSPCSKQTDIETFYHLISFLQSTGEFGKTYIIPYIRDYKIANFSSFINSSEAHKYITRIRNIKQTQIVLKPLQSNKAPENNYTYDTMFFSTELKIKGTSDLTYKAFKKHFTDIIGREYEISRLIDILSKMKKNNAVLIGNPGVGKTAIIEALANRIVQGKVPSCLKFTRIIELSLSDLIAGCRYRGDFEEKVKEVFNALEDIEDKIILFVDEIHCTISLGATSGHDSLSLSDMLKPFSMNSNIRIIGTSTYKDYKRFESDKALERRFDTITVEEPSFEDTLKILNHLRPQFEKNHNVEITDSALISVIKLSNQYIPDRFLPDKAIDVLDETCAIKVNSSSGDSSIKKILPKDVLACISSKKNISIIKLQQANNLENLDEILNSRVIGQSHAINSIFQAIQRAQTGLNDENRPLASFMFIGPTGVGKTEVAKVLADVLFTHRDSFIRFNMSEYSEEHSVAKLIGSPPGYIGYDDAGLLSEQVRRHPYSLVLFDEFEKAHPKIYNLLLQILDDGILTDSHGNNINFKNTIIILTSNVGVRECNKNSIGFAEKSNSNLQVVMDTVKRTFSPEFLNRLDEIIQFNSLSKEDIFQIAKLYINSEIVLKLRKKGISLDVKDDVIAKISQEGFSLEYGARELKRAITRRLKNPLADFLLQDNGKAKKISIIIDGENIKIIAKNLVTA